MRWDVVVALRATRAVLATALLGALLTACSPGEREYDQDDFCRDVWIETTEARWTAAGAVVSWTDGSTDAEPGSYTVYRRPADPDQAPDAAPPRRPRPGCEVGQRDRSGAVARHHPVGPARSSAAWGPHDPGA